MCRQLSVPRVSSSLQMRTVGRMTRVHIAKHRVNKGVIYPVECITGGFKARRDPNIRMDLGNGHRKCISRYFEISKSKPRKFCLYLPLLTVRYYPEALPVPMCRIQSSVRQNRLRKVHGDLFTHLCKDLYDRVSR